MVVSAQIGGRNIGTMPTKQLLQPTGIFQAGNNVQNATQA